MFNVCLLLVCCINIMSATMPKHGMWNESLGKCHVATGLQIEIIKRQVNVSLPHQRFKAWTGILTSKSVWAYFLGCIELNPNKVETVNFSREVPHTRLKDRFACASYCSLKGEYFLFHDMWCQCIYSVNENKTVFRGPFCIKTCEGDNNKVFCSSGSGVAIFGFRRDLKVENTDVNTIHSKNYCLTWITNKHRIQDCNNSFYFRCQNGDSFSHVNWVQAMNMCWQYDISPPLVGGADQTIEEWTGYFNAHQSNAMDIPICTVVSGSKHYFQFEYRRCLQQLPYVCLDTSEISTTIPSTVWYVTNSSSMDTSMAFLPEMDIFSITPVVAINIVLFVLCLCLGALFVFRHKRKRRSEGEKRTYTYVPE